MHVLVGFQAEELDVKKFSVQRDGVMFPTKPFLDLTSGLDFDGSKTDPSIYGIKMIGLQLVFLDVLTMILMAVILLRSMSVSMGLRVFAVTIVGACFLLCL